MDSSVAQQECKKSKMQPYLDTCYNPNNTNQMCDVSFNNAPANLMYCQSGAYTDTTHSINTCGINRKHRNYLDKQTYKAIRKWKQIGGGRSKSMEDTFLLKLLSFNILAQNLLETYHFLYKRHNKQALDWNIRKSLIIEEILDAEANIICLQEVQQDHLMDIVDPFRRIGYDYIYKKRTNEKNDGLLLLYRSDEFLLLDHAKVELYQSGIELLSRDNVGIIAKLALRSNPDTQIVVATTHLLYNPKRNDVRLAQIQLLLAEIERIAFVENTITGPKYLPILLSGDFNLEPYTGVYKFLTEGSFTYNGKGRSLESPEVRSLSNFLIPPRLCVTDNCQHFNILTKRLRKEGTGKIMLENSEFPVKKGENTFDTCNLDTLQHSNDSGRTQIIEIVQGYSVQFSSGTLTHPFKLRSVYNHTAYGEKEATTHQDEWVTVDYIFYSNIKPVEKYALLTVSQCYKLRAIPNFVVGSDHLCIGATFQLPKKKSSL
ncbi:protein angel isoform X2 [Pseudomyrmex gracilis]|nr:protein angel isoform X2 [Pseudomyrmex gracilis]XP_020280506.1 protein angel isoform X2 [Pseudomyrmex gracilis]XP_020280507.1 protein angel isoform X2 [Pseudomyrmex gracilis]XP_020280508.1 protein angel isoform X2 [Pseudomyrmex gracilis]XP_020280509.1 protein angel isoform X2 [Pseudomyrmex gracilis]